MTLKISKGSEYEFIRGDIEVSDIDPDKDIKLQLENSLTALNETWEFVVDQAGQKILAEVSTRVSTEYQMQVSKKLKALEDMMKNVKFEVDEIQDARKKARDAFNKKDQ
jgi:hypothetical protein